MNSTENYHLNQWEATDRVLRQDFNADNVKIDAALEEVNTRKGNCAIVTGTYIGTGTYGSSKPNRISFPQKPLLVFITGDRFFWTMYGQNGHATWSNTGATISITWNGNTMCWSTDDVNTQMNIQNKTYQYVALIPLS